MFLRGELVNFKTYTLINLSLVQWLTLIINNCKILKDSKDYITQDSVFYKRNHGREGERKKGSKEGRRIRKFNILLFFKDLFMHACICLHVMVYDTCVWVHVKARGVSGHLKLDWQMIVRCPVWMLKNKLGSSENTVFAMTSVPSL